MGTHSRLGKITFRYAAVLFVIIETFSVIRGHIVVRDWLPMFLLLAVALLFYPKSFFNKESLFLLLYLIVLLLFVVVGHTLGNLSWITVQVLWPLSCLAIINVFLYNRDFYGLKMVTVTGLFIIIITSLLTIPIVIKNPDAVRDMVRYAVETHDIKSIQFYQRLGIASYGLVHAIPFLYPVLVYHFKTEKKIIFKFYYLLTILVTFFMLIKSNVATPLILSTFGILAAFFLSKNRIRNLLFGIILFMCCILFLNENLVISGLKTIQPIFPKDTKIDQKIDDIVLSIKHGKTEGSVRRIELVEKSWNAFLQNPLCGNLNKKQAGGHAYFIDRLTYFGLVGTIPFIMFLYFTFKKHFYLFDRNIRMYYLISIFLFFVLGIFKNIGGIEPFLCLFVFLPGLCLKEIQNPN